MPSLRWRALTRALVSRCETNNAPLLMTRCRNRYGDIHPITTAGRATIMLMMATALLTIPRQTNKLVALLSHQSSYARQSYHGNDETEHIIVCGALGSVGSTGIGTGVLPR